jgi:hypothetical protein
MLKKILKRYYLYVFLIKNTFKNYYITKHAIGSKYKHNDLDWTWRSNDGKVNTWNLRGKLLSSA